MCLAMMQHLRLDQPNFARLRERGAGNCFEIKLWRKLSPSIYMAIEAGTTPLQGS